MQVCSEIIIWTPAIWLYNCIICSGFHTNLRFLLFSIAPLATEINASSGQGNNYIIVILEKRTGKLMNFSLNFSEEGEKQSEICKYFLEKKINFSQTTLSSNSWFWNSLIFPKVVLIVSHSCNNFIFTIFLTEKIRIFSYG